MIPYELARQLKEAGFPQSHRLGGEYFIENHSSRNQGIPDGTLMTQVSHEAVSTKRRVYAPTLSELIEACGVHVRLDWFPDQDSAWANCCDKKEHKQSGPTLDIAVANLYLALNPKKI